jgi:pimeloyl-ACP methyl ester carboxylesterase
MYYEIVGEGEPLVLLHGFNGTSSTWEPLVDDLASAFQLIIPDLRGHGSSTNPSGEFTHRQAALDVFALLDHLGVECVKAIGSSSGGMTLLHMATQQPDRIDSMVLNSATIYFPEQAREIMRSVDPSNIPEGQMEQFRGRHKRGDEQIIALQRQFNAFKDSYDDMNFTAPYLSTITASTLIVHGDRDQFFPARIALEMYEGIPRSYLWVVPNAGHVGGQADVRYFLDTVTPFLKNQW